MPGIFAFLRKYPIPHRQIRPNKKMIFIINPPVPSMFRQLVFTIYMLILPLYEAFSPKLQVIFKYYIFTI
ncbi:hypothetical protein ABE28_005735 [Peribacillus muralis]|uniref:Uncharacterized protein n=1 Tax=Peribacillus muralis TaxID=264697 RepID=A0A1B3XKU5_9BACI|nr:hypothetical protein ABE28_005735 [Peribacillus muralis]